MAETNLASQEQTRANIPFLKSGNRLAIGALEKNVLVQFLVEAMVLTSFGGLVDIVLGLAATYFISKPLQIPFDISLWVIGVAFVFSAAVGGAVSFRPGRRQGSISSMRFAMNEIMRSAPRCSCR